MLEREGVQLRLEDGELGLHGAEVRGAEGGAVGGVGRGDGGAVLESGQADTTARRHDALIVASGDSPSSIEYCLVSEMML